MRQREVDWFLKLYGDDLCLFRYRISNRDNVYLDSYLCAWCYTRAAKMNERSTTVVGMSLCRTARKLQHPARLLRLLEIKQKRNLPRNEIRKIELALLMARLRVKESDRRYREWQKNYSHLFK